MHVVLAAHYYVLPMLSVDGIGLLSEECPEGWVEFDWTGVICGEHMQPQRLVIGFSDRG